MKVKSMGAIKADRKKQMFLGGFVALAAAATLLLLLAAPYAAGPGGSAPAGKSSVATIEKVPGSPVPRVTLAAKAAERLGIQTGQVGEDVIVRKLMVGGLVIPPQQASSQTPQQAPQPSATPEPPIRVASVGFGGFGKGGTAPAPQPVVPQVKPAAPGDVWVLVTLSPGEWEKVAKDRPVRLLPLPTRDKSGKDVLAQPSGLPPIEDMKRSMLSVYYVVSGKDHGLTVNNRMRVELSLSGTQEIQKVVPYSAVFYDAQGKAWVYVNTKQLTYERQPISVERIEGDLAVLSDGPAVGTPVVTVGAPMLHGVEIFKK